jgi:hypothetical protein
MATPRKKKSRKTGRPLEDVPLRKLVKHVKSDLNEKLRLSFASDERKKREE